MLQPLFGSDGAQAVAFRAAGIRQTGRAVLARLPEGRYQARWIDPRNLLSVGQKLELYPSDLTYSTPLYAQQRLAVYDLATGRRDRQFVWWFHGWVLTG